MQNSRHYHRQGIVMEQQSPRNGSCSNNQVNNPLLNHSSSIHNAMPVTEETPLHRPRPPEHRSNNGIPSNDVLNQNGHSDRQVPIRSRKPVHNHQNGYNNELVDTYFKKRVGQYCTHVRTSVLCHFPIIGSTVSIISVRLGEWINQPTH